MSTYGTPTDSLFARVDAGSPRGTDARPSIDERWAPVPEWEGLYEVSDHGRVRSVSRIDTMGRQVGSLLNCARNSHGYPSVGLVHLERKRRYVVHRLVALAFVPNPDRLPIVMHMDESRDNNHFTNLRWGTQSENLRQANRSGRNNPPTLRGIEHKSSRLSAASVRVVRRCADLGLPATFVGEIFGVSDVAAGRVMRGRSWVHIGHETPLMKLRSA